MWKNGSLSMRQYRFVTELTFACLMPFRNSSPFHATSLLWSGNICVREIERSIILLFFTLTCSWNSEFLAQKHGGRILRYPSNPVCDISMMEQVRLCAVWPMENWLGSSLNQIHGWTNVPESYSRALEQGPLLTLTTQTVFHIVFLQSLFSENIPSFSCKPSLCRKHVRITHIYTFFWHNKCHSKLSLKNIR